MLVGPSGCGKSTLLRMIAGLEEVTDGEIRIGGKRVNERAPKDRDIAMVFQSYALYPHMNVAENMSYSLRIRKAAHGEDRRRGRQCRGKARAAAAARTAAEGAVGRPAPARRDGPRHRAPAQGLPVRRAAVQSRCAPARADARRDQEAAPRSRRHLDLCHPRPDRGDDAGRPHRRHACRRRAAGRQPAGALRPPRQPVRRRLHRLAGHEFLVRAL